MDSKFRLRTTLFVATSLATVTLAGCGLFEKQPPRYNTPVGSRHVPVLNPQGEGLKAFEPRVARWTYENEAPNIQAERTYPNTPEAAAADDYPDEAPIVPQAAPPAEMQMSAAPTGAEPSPLYYLEQQGLAPGQELLTTQQAAPAEPVSAMPLAPAQYEQEPVAPAETLPPQAANDSYPHLGEVPEVNQQVKDQAAQARNEANQAFAEQPAAIESANAGRRQLNNEADQQSLLPSETAPAPQEEVLAEQPADAVVPPSLPQQRRMLTSDEVDQSVLPQGLVQGQQQAAPNYSETELQNRMDQEMMAINRQPAPPPPPPAYAPPPAPMMAPPSAPDGAYAPMPVQAATPNEIMVDEPAPVAAAPVLTPPQLTPPVAAQVSPLQRRQQYLQESRYARIRSVHRAPRQY